jgi:hypothetical protein
MLGRVTPVDRRECSKITATMVDVVVGLTKRCRRNLVHAGHDEAVLDRRHVVRPPGEKAAFPRPIGSDGAVAVVGEHLRFAPRHWVTGCSRRSRRGTQRRTNGGYCCLGRSCGDLHDGFLPVESLVYQMATTTVSGFAEPQAEYLIDVS